MISQDELNKWGGWSRRDDWHNLFVGSDIRRMLGDIQRFRVALASIAANKCCDRCSEAAMVAQNALSPRADTSAILGRNTK